MVAPDSRGQLNRMLTLHKPLRIKVWPSETVCLGNPDGLCLGVLHLLPRKPDLVLSGINHGPVGTTCPTRRLGHTEAA